MAKISGFLMDSTPRKEFVMGVIVHLAKKKLEEHVYFKGSLSRDLVF